MQVFIIFSFLKGKCSLMILTHWFCVCVCVCVSRFKNLNLLIVKSAVPLEATPSHILISTLTSTLLSVNKELHYSRLIQDP